MISTALDVQTVDYISWHVYLNMFWHLQGNPLEGEPLRESLALLAGVKALGISSNVVISGQAFGFWILFSCLGQVW